MAEKNKNTAIAPRQTMLLSGQAQTLYDHAVDLKEDIKKVREKRQNALMKDSRYAALKKQAADIVKEAGEIQKKFDVKNPQYKMDMAELVEEAKEVSVGMNKVAVQALRQGVDLLVFHGRGPGKKRVKFALSCQPTLF